MGGRPEYQEEAEPARSTLRAYRVPGRSAVGGQKSDQALQIAFAPHRSEDSEDPAPNFCPSNRGWGWRRSRRSFGCRPETPPSRSACLNLKPT